jgi:hypothetical protein
LGCAGEDFACFGQELPLLAVRHALPDAQFPVEAGGGYELALGLRECNAVDRVLVSLQCKDALQALALAGLCCLGHSCDVENVANIVAAACCNDLGVHGVLCYAEDRVLMLVEMRYRVVLQVDLHLDVLVALLIAVHGNVAVIFDDLLGLFCVEYVILVVVIDLGLVVGLLCGHCERCCDYSMQRKAVCAVCCDYSNFMLWRCLEMLQNFHLILDNFFERGAANPAARHSTNLISTGLTSSENSPRKLTLQIK